MKKSFLMLISFLLFVNLFSVSFAVNALKEGGIAVPPVQGNASNVLGAIANAGNPSADTISFEFEKTKKLQGSEAINALRYSNPFLSDSDSSLILSVSDNIIAAKAMEILVFPLVYNPDLSPGSTQQAEFNAPTVEIVGSLFSADSFKFEIVNPGKAQYHTLNIKFSPSKNELESIKNNNGAAIVTIKIYYSPISKIGLGNAKESGGIKFEPNGVSFEKNIYIVYNPCKVLEAESLPADNLFEEIADCYSIKAELENAEFHERFWKNQAELEKIRDQIIEKHSIHFRDIPTYNEIISSFPQPIYQEPTDYLKDRYDIDVFYYSEFSNLVDAAKLDNENKAFSSLDNAESLLKLALQFAPETYDGKSRLGKLLNFVKNKKALLLDEEKVLKAPYNLDGSMSLSLDSIMAKYGDALDYYSTKSDGSKSYSSDGGWANVSAGARKYLQEKYGDASLEDALQAALSKIEDNIKKLEEMKSKKSSWEKVVALKQPGKTTAITFPKTGFGSEWNADLDESEIDYQIEKSKLELKSLVVLINEMHGGYKTSYGPVTQKLLDKGVITKAEADEMASINMSRQDIFSFYDSAIRELKFSATDAAASKDFAAQEKAKEQKISSLAAFQNSDVEKEFRARRYLANKPWLQNISEAYAFYDLVHALEQRRELLYLFQNQKKQSDLKALENIEKVLNDLETGKIKQLLESYKKGNTEIGTFLKSDPVASTEFEKLAEIEKSNSKMIEELSAKDGTGDNGTFEITIPNFTSQSNTKILSDLLDRKLYKIAFNYNLLTDTYSSNYTNFKDDSAVKKIAPHFSAQMKSLLAPATEQELFYNSNAFIYDKANKQYITKPDLQFEFPRGKDITYVLAYPDKDLGNLTNFFKIRYFSAEKVAQITVSIYNQKDNSYAELGTASIKGNLKIWLPSGTKDPNNPSKGDIIYLAIDDGSSLFSDKPDKLKEIRIKPEENFSKDLLPKVTVEQDYGTELGKGYDNTSIRSYVLGFGKTFFAASGNSEEYATKQSNLYQLPGNSFLDFKGINLDGKITDVNGLVRLLSMQTNEKGEPLFSKAPALKKLVEQKTPKDVLETIIFKTNEVLKTEKNPNSILGKISDKTTKQNISTDTRQIAMVSEKIADYRLIPLEYLFGKDYLSSNRVFFSTNAIFEESFGKDSASDSILEKSKIVTLFQPSKIPQKTIVKEIPAKKNENVIVNETDCDNSETCIITFNTNIEIGPEKEIQTIFFSYYNLQDSLILANQLDYDNGKAISIQYTKKMNYSLKRIVLFGGSKETYPVPEKISFFDKKTVKGKAGTYKVNYLSTEFSVVLNGKTPLTFSPNISPDYKNTQPLDEYLKQRTE